MSDHAENSAQAPALTWGGRFREPPHPLAQRYGASIQLDVRLYRCDITASIAHARMLGRQQIIPAGEAGEIVAGLQQVLADFDDGKVELREDLEDIHTHVENRLREIIGEAAGKLHTARSRNDQIATDLRLYTRDACDGALARLRALRAALAGLALAHAADPMPGYTHLQHAQPVTLGHHLLAYAEMFGRDESRFQDCRKRLNLLPLGAGALAGSPYPLDRDWVARELGFDGVTANSMDAVADRDFIAEYLFAASLTMTHVSRLAEEVILWAAPEFGFVQLQDAFSTGSSIMPQKKNPDPMELARGKTAIVLGNLMAMLAMLKGLPLTYNRDLQEDKRPLFETADTLLLTLELVAEMLPGLRFKLLRLREQASAGFSLATDVADYLVRKGMPFRKAHGVAGSIVQFCETEGRDLAQVRLDEYRRFSELFERDVYDILSIEAALEARAGVPGSAAPSLVRARAEALLAEFSEAP